MKKIISSIFVYCRSLLHLNRKLELKYLSIPSDSSLLSSFTAPLRHPGQHDWTLCWRPRTSAIDGQVCARNTETHRLFRGIFWGVWTVTGKLGPAMDGAIRCLDDGQTVFRRTRTIPRFWSLDRFTVAATRFHRVFSSFHGFHQMRNSGISVC